jgi:peptidylprolyl isomerase
MKMFAYKTLSWLSLCSLVIGYRPIIANRAQLKIQSPSQTVFASTVDTAAAVRRSEITKDGEVKKEVITSGNGRKIEVGDILAVEYAAYVAGNKKPFAKNEQEKFTFKDGTMIKGWDLAVESMKVGEKAKFVLGSSYAYGAKGVGQVIPPHSAVELEIKIQAWLGNAMRPESLFQKDLDVDPFIASTPESIQAEFDQMQVSLVSPFLESHLTSVPCLDP